MTNQQPEIIYKPPPGRTREEVFLFVAAIQGASVNVDAELAAALSRPSLRESKYRPTLEAGLRVIADLRKLGWKISRPRESDHVTLSLQRTSNDSDSRATIRQEELLKRDEQLRSPATVKFVQKMERRRFHGDEYVSVLSLLRDGRDLAEALARAQRADDGTRADPLQSAVDPYLCFFSSEDRCVHTGLRLMDSWRYFRHTWTSQYQTVPGRAMPFLVRDKAAKHHPVIGIGALSSAVVQLKERDRWIGWTADLLASRAESGGDDGAWLLRTLAQGFEETYTADFLRDGVVTQEDLRSPTKDLVDSLRRYAKARRSAHVEERLHTSVYQAPAPEEPDSRWAEIAETNLFKSKRALALADLLEARAALIGFDPGHAATAALVATKGGRRAFDLLARRAKAARVGVAIADLNVCGAIPPYSPLLGGKLVAMLAASPESVEAYRSRYSDVASDIASKVAGRRVVRPADLVMIGTTSLYGRSAQYNRVSVPAARLGGAQGKRVRYERLGSSEGHGSSQFSNETLRALEACRAHTQAPERTREKNVRGIFGEGVSPKLRGLREGLTAAGFRGDVLKHARRRDIYGVRLVDNLLDYLIGAVDTPSYIVTSTGSAATASVAAWWRERWLRKRAARADVIDKVVAHRVAAPIRHGGRVPLPEAETNQLKLFEDL